MLRRVERARDEKPDETVVVVPAANQEDLSSSRLCRNSFIVT
jgi:hypothetical protein